MAILSAVAINIARKNIDKSITKAKVIANANIRKIIDLIRT